MKIVFLCGSLEPGRDGVGDYTRRLAAELLRQKHQATIIALHDPQLTGQIVEDLQPEEDQLVYTLRLSNKLSWADRVREAQTFINANNPDWISLQYVPFAFHEKGLPVGLSKVLQQLIGSRPVHIMFHELWVGLSKQSSKRHRLLGFIQRYLVRSLLTTLRPYAIHTHTPLYQIQLDKLGTPSLILPLFSNIPQVTFTRNRTGEHTGDVENQIKFVFFGGISPNAPVNELAAEVARYADKKKITAKLTIIGRNGPEQATWVTAWRSHGFTVTVLGEQSLESISKVLLQSSIGLSTTPAVLSGKSGSIAAMHAHGLPVLCVSAPWRPRNLSSFKMAPGVSEYIPGNFEPVMNSRKSLQLPAITVTDVAHQLLDTLLLINNRSLTTPLL
jgi:hypothetical protein